MSKPFDLADLPDLVWERQFVLAAQMPIAWGYSAQLLKRAADLTLRVSESANQTIMRRLSEEMAAGKRKSGSRVLSDDESALHYDSSLIIIYLFLTGFAMESLAKGIIVARDPGVALGPSKKLAPNLNTHDLARLVGQCLGPLIDHETDVLNGLTEYTTWRGRYPIPTAWTRTKPRKNARGEWAQPSSNVRPADVALIEDLFGRLAQAFGEERARRWTREDTAALQTPRSGPNGFSNDRETPSGPKDD